ncbi:hypothetical protein [Devosia sp. SD17-2]|uniref:hypothetical protein n=1 Tax=Devosia sp. SD17-2 TaxID=2976459 RepID=UPI0023D8942B|nr:hypothetical protein [Devosia sp. SD17-2]WEJ34112.1 hypothetical protein NYQ88_04725 [Devosia sp. SD17-2]
MKGERTLAPSQRVDFGEALVPPEGYRLEAALGTTFSMDIATALTVPVAMALRGGVERDELLENPLAALAAIRRLQDRVRIFVEAGNIRAVWFQTEFGNIGSVIFDSASDSICLPFSFAGRAGRDEQDCYGKDQMGAHTDLLWCSLI